MELSGQFDEPLKKLSAYSTWQDTGYPSFRIIFSCLLKVKVKSLCLINWALGHEGVWGSGCIDSYFLDLGTSWRWVVRFKPRPLYLRYPLDRRLVRGLRTGLDDVKKRKISSLSGLELRSLGSPARNQSLHCAIPAHRLQNLHSTNGVYSEKVLIIASSEIYVVTFKNFLWKAKPLNHRLS
jgi:hypothetical protein